jgi:hypothetical protein
MKITLEELLSDFQVSIDATSALIKAVNDNAKKYSNPEVAEELQVLMQDPKFIELGNESNHLVQNLLVQLGVNAPTPEQQPTSEGDSVEQ